MHQRAFALVAMLLMTGVAAAQLPQPIPVQQRARQFVQPTATAASPDAGPALVSPAYYAQQQALAANAAPVAQQNAADQPAPTVAPPRPSLMAPTLAPSPASPGLIKAPGAIVKAPTRPTIDPTVKSQRPVPPPAPEILPSPVPTGRIAQGKAPAGKTREPAPIVPPDDIKPATPSEDPFATPPGETPPVVVPPDEPPSNTPAESPLDPQPGPVIEPPMDAPVEEMPAQEAPAGEQPAIPDETFEENPPRTPPPAAQPAQPPRKPRRPESIPAPRSGGAPRVLPEPESVLAPTQPQVQGIPMPAGVPPGLGAHYNGPDGFGYGDPTEVFVPRRPRRPFMGLGGATFSGYYDRYCPPECPPCNFEDCRPPCGTWATFDALAWWSRGASLPALVTTGSQTFGGALNAPMVQVLFGNQRVDNEVRAGGRLNIGTWVDGERTIGIGGAFFDLQRSVTNFNAGSNGDPLLARPFFDTTTLKDDAQIVAESGIASGNVHVRTTADAVGGDLYMRIALDRGNGRLLDFVQGYRYLQINDSINIDDSIVSTDPSSSIPLGTSITGTDQFSAANQFNGWQFGLLSERRIGRVTFGGSGKLGIGNMRQVVNIYGSNAVTIPGVEPVIRPGSLLAQPSNMGRYARDTFGFVPEFNFNLGYQITSRLRANVGYSFIWINRVAQAGRQISTSIDSNQLFGLPGTAPTFHFQENSYWLQGMNLGFDYRF